MDLTLVHEGGAVGLHDSEGRLLAEGAALDALELEPPPSVGFERAERASARFVGFDQHPYPGCFVCGPGRSGELGPGLGLFPGAVEVGGAESARTVAAPFRPSRDLCDARGSLCSEYVWAALDCPSWFGHSAFAESTAPVLLGRLAARVLRRPQADERCVVQGFAIGRDGRRILCGSALYGEDGACIAYGRATWVELKTA